ncbi:MAG: TAXI family TRAP transporter solute-binding subunit [Hyphomicrobiaceae bacterium]
MVLRLFRDLPARALWLPAIIAAALTGVPLASAQQSAFDAGVELLTDRGRINTNTVGIMSGKTDSAYLAAVEDMAAVLDDGYELRIVAMIGKGAIQNISDVISLQNTDMGVTQANVLSYLKKRQQLGPNIEGRLRYVAKLFNEEVHVVARTNVNDLRDLAGQTVNVGEPGSGTQLTAQLVFEALNIQVKPVNMVQSDALAALQRGEIAATVLVAGKPTPIFDIFRLKGDLKLLSIPYEEALEADYLPTRFTHDDYPTLIPQGETIDTVAVPAVLAVFNWRKGTDRYRRVAKFVDAFFGKFEEFRKAPRHPKWREVNLAADVPGWQRFDAAKEWLARNAAKVANANTAAPAPAAPNDDAQRRTFLEFLAAQGGGAANPAQQEALFRKFLEWSRQNRGAAPTAAAPTVAAPTGAPDAPADAKPSGLPAPGQRLW